MSTIGSWFEVRQMRGDCLAALPFDVLQKIACCLGPLELCQLEGTCAMATNRRQVSTSVKRLPRV